MSDFSEITDSLGIPDTIRSNSLAGLGPLPPEAVDSGVFAAPVFGTNGRANPKDIDLNEVFQDYFVMSDFGLCDDLSSSKTPIVAGGKDGSLLISESSSSLDIEEELSENEAEVNFLDVPIQGSGKSIGEAPRTNTRSRAAPTRAAAAAASAAWAPYGNEDAEDGGRSPSSASAGNGLSPTTSRPPARKSSAPTAKKPKLQPSGFAGISAIASSGPGGALTTVKNEPQQGTKKRRRRPDPRAMSEDQRVERRERNREHAKRSRIRKKFLLESLQQQLTGLRSENTGLRDIVKRDIPAPVASNIMGECLSEESFSLLDSDMRLAAEETAGRAGGKGQNGGSNPDGGALGPFGSSGGDDGGFGDACDQGGQTPGVDCSRGLPDGVGGQARALTEPDYRLMSSLMNCQQNFTVSDPALPDNPIVYASEGFLTLTGYERDQVLGRNCRFLQGPKTDQRMVDVIRKGVAAGEDTSVCLLNYKQDGTPFWNQFFVAALRDGQDNIVNYVGVQCAVDRPASVNGEEVPTLPEYYGGDPSSSSSSSLRSV
mmetsp:Transcript_33300/g.68119  ORF Transcript_33300/g.68119 Transcript_33300/m.68119 type:complete len:542 (+) Transcript_33300:2-1627(+)